MIIDSSAILAIALAEPERRAYAETIAAAAEPRMSIASYIEVALRLDTLGQGFDPELDALVERLGIELVPVSLEQGRVARTAALRFGRGKPARLNFGDCLTYALAKVTGAPLLFKGNDFDKTDLEVVSIAG